MIILSLGSMCDFNLIENKLALFYFRIQIQVKELYYRKILNCKELQGLANIGALSVESLMDKPTTSRSGFLHTSDFVRFDKTHILSNGVL